MMITRIEELDKRKVKLFLDFEFAFVLYKGELRTLHLKENQEMELSVYEEITGQILPKRAKLRCMNLLKSRPYTERQLRDKLKQGFYPLDIIDEAVSYVKSYHYVDDEGYARDYIEYHMESKSKKKLEQILTGKGIDRGIFDKIFAQCTENGNKRDELGMAKELLRKKNFSAENATIKEIRKISGYLYRKGFDSETIRRALLLDITPI